MQPWETHNKNQFVTLLPQAYAQPAKRAERGVWSGSAFSEPLASEERTAQELKIAHVAQLPGSPTMCRFCAFWVGQYARFLILRVVVNLPRLWRAPTACGLLCGMEG